MYTTSIVWLTMGSLLTMDLVKADDENRLEKRETSWKEIFPPPIEKRET